MRVVIVCAMLARVNECQYLCRLSPPCYPQSPTPHSVTPTPPLPILLSPTPHPVTPNPPLPTLYSAHRNFEQLIPDAPELIQGYLEGEQDPSCKRNAFMMLVHVDQERALDYLSTCIDQVNSFNEILQLVIVELVYKVRGGGGG